MALVRLQKLLSQAGITSRRDAESYIQTGRVLVNGKVADTLGVKADPEKDKISVDNQRIHFVQERLVLMMHKPPKVMVTLDDPQKRQTVLELLQERPISGPQKPLPRVYPVGRLDYDAEGLLLLTNDGDLANQLMHPRYKIPKTYLVKVSGVVNDRDLKRIEQGMFLKDNQGKVKKTLPVSVSLHRKTKQNAWYEITVFEGRNHLVKNLFAAIRHPVRRILRIEFAGLKLGPLPQGAWRYLQPHEMATLHKWSIKEESQEA